MTVMQEPLPSALDRGDIIEFKGRGGLRKGEGKGESGLFVRLNFKDDYGKM